MPRIPAVTLASADAATAATLAGVQAKLGLIPNVVATLAQSTAAVKGYLSLSSALAGGRLSARQREIVALAVAQANRCEYCLAAHTALGKGAGLTDEQIAKAREGTSGDVFDAALASLAATIVAKRGVLSDADVDAAREAGVDDGLVLEVVANVALNVLTNYTNHIARTEVDFPAVAVGA